jgi:hypothetical protein
MCVRYAVYVEHVRVPFYAKGPGIKPKTQIPEMISNIDIGPTLCELAGIKPPTLMDGRSLVPLLVGARPPRPWRTHFMTEFAEGGNQEWGTNKMWNTTANYSVDINMHPPWGPGCLEKEDCNMNRTDGLRWDYAYDSPDYNWRQLRVINATHDFSFTQFDGSYHLRDISIATEIMDCLRFTTTTFLRAGIRYYVTEQVHV